MESVRNLRNWQVHAEISVMDSYSLYKVILASKERVTTFFWIYLADTKTCKQVLFEYVVFKHNFYVIIVLGNSQRSLGLVSNPCMHSHSHRMLSCRREQTAHAWVRNKVCALL